jgi:dihydrofolate reductase
MAKLIYSSIASLDGYVADADGNFGWAAPDAEVHAFVNDLERPIGTYLYGRRMYEVMAYWQTAPTDDASEHPVTRDFAQIWKAAEKIVYSTTLESASTPKTRIEPTFDAGYVRELKTSAEQDLGIGGPTIAAEALRAGLVDEYHVFLNPVIVGGGNPSLPDGVRLDLDLLAERRFGGGVVYLQYRVHN